jgi:hypothetical protein
MWIDFQEVSDANPISREAAGKLAYDDVTAAVSLS